MKKIIIGLLIVAIIVIGAYLIYSAFSNKSETDTTATTYGMDDMGYATSTAPQTPAAPVASTVTVSITNFTYDPSPTYVKVGTKVTWINNDTVPHTVTSDSGTTLNSPTLAPGQSYSVTLNDLGSISYHCKLHPMMHGTIVVTSGLGS